MKMIYYFRYIFLFSLLISIVSCTKKYDVDTVYVNGKVYTVDSAFHIVQAFAVRDGKIVLAGTNEDVLRFSCKNKVDLKGKFVYPGFIDAHCHFFGYGIDLPKINLTGTKSFAEVLAILSKNKDQKFMGWIFGRGWDQNDWAIKEYPGKAALDSMFPDVPVFLMRIDGHAALVNQKALDLAGVNEQTKVEGGELLSEMGMLTGLLIDNAVDLVKIKIAEPSDDFKVKYLLEAQKNCFQVGLTTVDDAGLNYKDILLLDSIQKSKSLKMRIYAMIMFDSSNVAYYRKNGKYKSDRLNVRSFKLYGDGALGSRGACMLAPYADMPGHFGFLLHSPDSIQYAATTAAEMGFQLNTHCIGDSANRLLLNIYANTLQGENDFRWRIEHAQIVNEMDLPLFSQYKIIPSVQPTHATSDMYWAADRIGAERMKNAYAYKKLLEQNKMIANGSDFPVEDINPLYGFYAAVSRKDQKLFPEGGFQKENALTREEALRAMTIWAAYSNFEENEKGSIEPNKWADFVILPADLMSTPENDLFKIKVEQTFIAGEKVF